MKLIPDWHTKKQTCSVCGNEKSVKYEAENGKPMCNKCICLSKNKEVELESIIKLMPCQRCLTRIPDERGVGVTCVCKLTNVMFYDDTYLSRLNITETCKKNCVLLQQT